MTSPQVLEWHAEERPCPCCRSVAFKALGLRGGRAHHSGQGRETSVVRCRSCHAVYPRPFLIPEGNPYEALSAVEYFHGQETAAKLNYGAIISEQARNILGRTGRMLELGCGQGELLLAARAAGWQVSGVEMTAAFAAARPDLDIEIAPVASARSLDRTYDVVVLSAILEHLYEPAECLRRVHGALEEGGLVFIDVPNECSLWTRLGNAYMRLRGRSWAVNLSPTFPPFHVVGFCPRSLATLLNACGFSVLELKTQRWQSELPRKDGFWGALEVGGGEIALTLGARIGMGAGITAWARRG